MKMSTFVWAHKILIHIFCGSLISKFNSESIFKINVLVVVIKLMPEVQSGGKNSKPEFA